MPLDVGEIINNRYRIVRLLGEGGFGAVYRAWDINLKGPVAVKENREISPQAQKQFTHEAELLFKLRHPNLPRVTDHFFVPEQGQYLVMDYVEGQDLQTMLDARGGKPLPEQQVLPWVEQVCDALTYLHSQDPPILHRDIKPGNIKITPDGKAMLVDFGIAKVYDPDHHTTVGARAVTPGYSPPEQYGTGTDAQSDVYALGATIFTLLTGKVPPPSVELLAGTAPPPQPINELNREVSPEVSVAVACAMQLKRINRTASLEEFRQSLKPVAVQPVSATVVAAAPPLNVETVRHSPAVDPAPRQTPWKLIIGGLGLILVAALAVLGIRALADQDDNGGAGLTSTAAALVIVTDTATPDVVDTVSVEDTLAAEPTETHTQEPVTSPTSTQLVLQVELPVLILDGQSVPMGYVPAGSFEMGSEDGEGNELPVHTVWLDPYSIDLYEVTNARYAECVREGACDEPANLGSNSRKNYYTNPDYGNHPVLNVSWQQAQAYCEWRGARLPTEAEWEDAARGSLIGEKFPWGNEQPVCQPGLQNGALYDDDDACPGTDTSEVGSFQANGYGLFDMAGSLWEWVADWYKDSYYAESPQENPQGPLDGEDKVIHGGSWADSPAEILRVSFRGNLAPESGSTRVGFRCARSVSDVGSLLKTAEAYPENTATPSPTLTLTQSPSPTATIKPTNTYKPLPTNTPTTKPKPPEPTEPPEPPTATPAP